MFKAILCNLREFFSAEKRKQIYYPSFVKKTKIPTMKIVLYCIVLYLFAIYHKNVITYIKVC